MTSWIPAMDTGDYASITIAASGALGVWLSHRLGILGQRKDSEQQKAAHRLAERMEYFDELESLNDRLSTENKRLQVEVDRWRDMAHEADVRGDLRLAQQAQRCRSYLNDAIATISLLQGVVTSEMARAQAGDAIEEVARHTGTDHPDDDENEAEA